MASQENDGGPDGALRENAAPPGPEAGPDSQPALPPTCGAAEAGGFLEASIFRIEDLAPSFVKDFRLKGKKDLQAFAEEAKACGATLVAVAKGGKDFMGQAGALAKCGLSVKLVSLKKVGRALPSSIPLPDAQWAAILAWCLQSQAGRIEEGIMGQLAELAAHYRKCEAFRKSAGMAYLTRARQSGADFREIVGKGMGEIGMSILEGAKNGLSEDEMIRRVKTFAKDEIQAGTEAMDQAIFMAAAPGADEAIAKLWDERRRWIDASEKASDQIEALLIERGQAANMALLSHFAGISGSDSLALLAELSSFFSDI